MIRKRQRNSKLKPHFDQERQGAKPGRHAGRFEVPPEKRRGEICRAENVKPAREHGAGDARETGAVPCYLGLVD